MMEREILIVIRVEKSYAYGWFEEKTQGKDQIEKETLKIDAQDRFQWNEEVLKRILTNIQVNREKDVCRILLCADQEMPENLFPSLQKERAWELEEIAEKIEGKEGEEKAGVFSGLYAREWYLNGHALKGPYRK